MGDVAVVKTKRIAKWYHGGVASAMAACCTHPLDLLKVYVIVFCSVSGAAASSLGSAVSCRVEGRAIDTALGQCFIPNSSH